VDAEDAMRIGVRSGEQTRAVGAGERFGAQALAFGPSQVNE
jgi:hypothetical protein